MNSKKVDKEFMKQNDFAVFLERSKTFAKDYKWPLVAVLGVVLIFSLGIPTYKIYRESRAQDFSDAFYQAQFATNKEKTYKKAWYDFQDLPAARLAVIRLVDHYLDQNLPSQAFQLADEVLQNTSSQVDILSTLIVIKKVDALKIQGRLEDAVKAMGDHAHMVLPSFRSRLKLMRADLLLAQGKNDDAKSIYQSLASKDASGDLSQVDKLSLAEYDPAVVNEAKEQLLFLELRTKS